MRNKRVEIELEHQQVKWEEELGGLSLFSGRKVHRSCGGAAPECVGELHVKQSMNCDSHEDLTCADHISLQERT